MGVAGDRWRSVLLLSGGNNPAIQLADGLIRRLGGEQFAIYGAGMDGIEVEPLAVQVLGEQGIDARGWVPPPPYDRPPRTLDHVITLCVTNCET
jgi:arsenate reductase